MFDSPSLHNIYILYGKKVTWFLLKSFCFCLEWIILCKSALKEYCEKLENWTTFLRNILLVFLYEFNIFTIYYFLFIYNIKMKYEEDASVVYISLLLQTTWGWRYKRKFNGVIHRH